MRARVRLGQPACQSNTGIGKLRLETDFFIINSNYFGRQPDPVTPLNLKKNPAYLFLGTLPSTTVPRLRLDAFPLRSPSHGVLTRIIFKDGTSPPILDRLEIISHKPSEAATVEAWRGRI